MSELNINGVTLELDLFDADVLESYQNLNQKVVAKVQDKTRYDGMSTPDAFREQCKIIDEFFDEMFGIGTSQKLFGGKANIMKHMEAFAVVSKEAETANIQMDALKNKYAPNRVQRRQEQKNGSRNFSAGKKRHS